MISLISHARHTVMWLIYSNATLSLTPINMSIGLLSPHQQRSLLEYLRRDTSLPEDLVDVALKLEVSLAMINDPVCVYFSPSCFPQLS